MGRNWLSTATSAVTWPRAGRRSDERELRAESVRIPGVISHLLRPKQALRGGEHSS